MQDPVLARLLEDHRALTMVRSPFWATPLGDRRYNDRLGSVAPEDQALAVPQDRALLARAAALTLTGRDEVIRRVFLASLEAEVAEAACDLPSWPCRTRTRPGSARPGWATTTGRPLSVGRLAPGWRGW